MLYPLLFKSNIYSKVWGGNLLKTLKGISDGDTTPMGESWEISAVPGKESVVANGSLQGRKLNELVTEYKEELIGRTVYDMYGETFPLLIKFIDAAKDLSIQVHPDDEMARKYHDSFGKTEMWYIMDTKPGAKLYSGFKSQISKYEYGKRIEDGSICDVLAEVQQSADLTYRIFDYNRPGLDGYAKKYESITTSGAYAVCK